MRVIYEVRFRTRGSPMNRHNLMALGAVLLAGTSLAGCGGRENADAGAPPALKVEHVDPDLFHVEHPEQFPLATAVQHEATSELKVTGTVNPDISRSIPVISLASGRILEITARLGDTVEKGQVLLRLQSADIAGAYSDYQKAVADEQLAAAQLKRAQDLYDKGAISMNDFEVAKDTESKAQVDVKTTGDKLRVLGVANLDHASDEMDIRAPITGVITDQQVTNAAGVQGLSSPNPFTISDLSYVWILCDVYENDLPTVRLGDKADIRLNAYPDKVFTGTISNISPTLDPNIRTAKVRIEVRNPGVMRPGMFATATFHGKTKLISTIVPAAAVLHLHDRDWVYVPADNNSFRRIEVRAADMLPGNMQEILSGIAPGQTVVANALEFQNTAEQ
jgi:membrane fusion protein, heavy metal efflux system